MLRRINDVLPELILEILIYGIIVQLVGVWFVADKLKYAIGLWLGIIMAMCLALHMATVIRNTVDSAVTKKATTQATVFSIIRYVAVVTLFLVVLYFKIGNVFAMFIGVMGLKAAAYLWPFTHKINRKRKERRRDG